MPGTLPPAALGVTARASLAAATGSAEVISGWSFRRCVALVALVTA